ncbi:hypothetical protein INR49_020719 [Caranx melampygus]|nr:hypothetical protein INR49_020719 [Caranx melampygus]
MMLPVSSFKGQPVGMVTTTLPWLTLSSDPAPQWLWLARWSAATYQATPPLVLCPPTVWIPEHTHLIQWERPAVEVVRILPPFYHSSLLHHHTCLPKLFEGWISPEEVAMFQRRDKHLLPINQIIQSPGVHAPRTHLLPSPSQLTGHVTRGNTNTKAGDTSPASSSSSLHLISLSPPFTAPAPGGDTRTLTWTGGGDSDGVQLCSLREKGVWPLVLSNQQHRQAWLHPIISLERRRSPPTQVMKQGHPSIFTSRFSSKLTLVTDYTHKKQGMSGGKLSYGGALLLRRERTLDDTQCVCVNRRKEEEREQGRKDKLPVASTPVPGSPWCVVWTGDDQVFFFNPTIHLSVWERPGDLIGRDISHIIEDPPHKRKKTHADGSYLSSGLHGNDDDDEHEHSSKKNRVFSLYLSRVEEPMSLVPCPGEVQLLPLELRVTHFREMMLERGVSAFSTWEKELHKMVFDPRYLLLTSDQRKQVFDQFVKSRVKDEYKENKSKQQKAREEFRQLLEEAKISHRSTFKEFCARYRGDQRFSALNRKKEQEMLFSHYITSLKKENRARLRKMR